MRKSKRAWKIKMIILSLSLYIYTINSMKRVRKLSEYRNKPGSRYAIFFNRIVTINIVAS